MMLMRLPRFSSRRIIILSENKKFNQREPRLYLNKKISGHHVFFVATRSQIHPTVNETTTVTAAASSSSSSSNNSNSSMKNSTNAEASLTVVAAPYCVECPMLEGCLKRRLGHV